MIAFNTAEGCARDVTQEIAREIVDTGEPLSRSARDFVERALVICCPPISRGTKGEPASGSAMLASDTRTEAQRWLNDPESGRSAVAQRGG